VRSGSLSRWGGMDVTVTMLWTMVGGVCVVCCGVGGGDGARRVRGEGECRRESSMESLEGLGAGARAGR